MEVANRLMVKGKSASETEQAAVYHLSCSSQVFVEKCKYLEESKCLGICINTCKLPTQIRKNIVRANLPVERLAPRCFAVPYKLAAQYVNAPPQWTWRKLRLAEFLLAVGD
ncbi:hypothetical protein C2845_PM11G30350 [Panicum miliaceum]|uniref:Beta-carotene isomerase D27-like C-terminal domain-containing protein n=1 Tax=Panicum miliaceum TaxID=4540 RepID=A0A3L6RVI6_PANMI|nr:hypothetical protein C2845_PM11G30350 [Panicum miliaceum]